MNLAIRIPFRSPLAYAIAEPQQPQPNGSAVANCEGNLHNISAHGTSRPRPLRLQPIKFHGQWKSTASIFIRAFRYSAARDLNPHPRHRSSQISGP
jgi:hypothetical protein